MTEYPPITNFRPTGWIASIRTTIASMDLDQDYELDGWIIAIGKAIELLLLCGELDKAIDLIQLLKESAPDLPEIDAIYDESFARFNLILQQQD